jgi:hypothetical protein
MGRPCGYGESQRRKHLSLNTLGSKLADTASAVLGFARLVAVRRTH